MVSVHIYQREANKGKKKGKKSFQKDTLINADNVLFNVKKKKKTQTEGTCCFSNSKYCPQLISHFTEIYSVVQC